HKSMAFIVFEGLDASGKSTLMNLLKARLEEKKIEALFLRDPGSTPLGESLRQLILSTEGEAPVPRAETLMYQAARVQMVDKIIKPSLDQGQWILCDRFYSSTVAFQSFARHLDLAEIESLNEFVAGHCPPDLFVFLDIMVEESQRRKAQRAKELGVEQDRMEREAVEFQERVREGYLYQANKNSGNWLVLDGRLSPEELLAETLNELSRRQWLPS
ncbi:MAG: dTMP kinase, partial [Pseudomonadota bacterium]